MNEDVIYLIVAFILLIGFVHTMIRQRELNNESDSSEMEESKLDYRKRLSPYKIMMMYLLLAAPFILYNLFTAFLYFWIMT